MNRTLTPWGAVDPEAEAIASEVFGIARMKVRQSDPIRQNPIRSSSLQNPNRVIRKDPNCDAETVVGGRAIRDWDTCEVYAAAVIRLLGVNAGVGEPFRSVLPGADVEAVVERGQNGAFVYRESGKRGYALADAYASFTSNSARRYRKGPNLAAWKVDSLVRSGLVVVPSVLMPPIPTGACPVVVRAARRIQDLFDAKWGVYQPEPTMLSHRFLEDWSGLTESQAKRARSFLIESGYVVKAGTKKCGPFLATLWRPGDCP